MSKKKPNNTNIVLRNFAKEDFLTFCQLMPGDAPYHVAPIHEVMAKTLTETYEKVQRGEKVRVILSIPPRHGKTLTASSLFPAWALGKNPKMRFILATYGAELSEKNGMKTRDLIASPQYRSVFPHIRLRADLKSKRKWMIEYRNKKGDWVDGGTFTGVGMGGSVTGIGADCVIPYCTIRTEGGIIPISKLKVGDKVLAYDHRTNKELYTTVRAVAAKRSKKRIITRGNLMATEDHKIYTKNKGYIPLSQATDNDEYIMSRLWFHNTEKGWGVTKKIQQWTKSCLLFTQMRNVCKKFKKTMVRNMFWEKILPRKYLPRLFYERKTQSNGAQNMPRMFKRLFSGIIRRTKGWHKILQSRVLSQFYKKKFTKNKNKKNRTVQPLQKRDRTETKILQSSLLYSIQTIWFNVKTIWGRLAKSKGNRSEPRRQGMCSVCGEKDPSTCSSFRQKFRKQRHEEPCYCLHKVPLQYSSDEGTCAEDIARLHGFDNYVVDIQTDTHNFFCENILIHNCIILDDPHKDRAEAESKVVRDRVWEYFKSTLYSRLEGAGAIIVIMQRWHTDDLVGRLEQEKEHNPDSDSWEVIKFPAIADEDEYLPDGTLFRGEGEPLWPEKFPNNVLANIKTNVGLYNWYSQYQQNPIIQEDGHFNQNMFQYYTYEDIKNKQLDYYTLVDPAVSLDKNSDEAVIVTIAKEKDGPHIYRIEETAGHMKPKQLIDTIFEHYKKYHPRKVVLESIALQKTFKYSLEEEQRKRETYFKIHPVKKQNKEERIKGLISLYEAGIIFHRKKLDLKYEEQLLQFPRGRHDDRIDAMSFCLEYLKPTAMNNLKRYFIPEITGYYQ